MNPLSPDGVERSCEALNLIKMFAKALKITAIQNTRTRKVCIVEYFS